MNCLFLLKDTLDLELAREKENIADLEEQIQRTSIELDRERKGVTSTDNVSDFRLVEMNQRRDRMLESWKSRLHAVSKYMRALHYHQINNSITVNPNMNFDYHHHPTVSTFTLSPLPLLPQLYSQFCHIVSDGCSVH